MTKNISITNLIKYGYFETPEQAYMHFNDLKQVPLCRCGNPKKFKSFYSGYDEFCDSPTHEQDKHIISEKRRIRTIKFRTESLLGYDDFVQRNLVLYMTDYPFIDPFNGRMLRNLDQFIRRSESGLKFFDYPSKCVVCEKIFNKNVFLYNKQHCNNRSCRGISLNNPELKTWKQKYPLDTKTLLTIKKSLLGRKEELDSLITQYIDISQCFGEQIQTKYLAGLVFWDDLGYLLEFEAGTKTVSYYKHGFIDRVEFKDCVQCGSKYLYKDLVFQKMNKKSKFKKVGQEYTCSQICYNEVRGNSGLYPKHAKQQKRWGKELKGRILSGQFTPKITNSWQKSRVYIDNIAFRSSWEAYFYLHHKIVNLKILQFEKLRIPYHDPLKDISRVYIVDFIDIIGKTVFEIKPSQTIDETELQKESQLVKWCQLNGYKYELITEDWFCANYNVKLLSNLDEDLSQDISRKLKQFEDC